MQLRCMHLHTDFSNGVNLSSGGHFICPIRLVVNNTSWYVSIAGSNTHAGQLNTPILSFDGPTLTLTCRAIGGPPTTLTWLRNGNPIVIDGMIYSQSQTVVDMETAEYETTLTADGLSSLVGVIECVASNARGTATSNNVTVISESFP